ncbi:MAG: Rieske 2Fe-2S domain-containing protein [Bacteroidetes bacterium]|nr:Rieske 2Fe-2S domain-containing protein [Bacteroidota bacterium]
MNYKWQKICESATELENLFLLSKIQTMQVFGTRVCVVKTAEGVYAFRDKCPHNGAALSMGFFNEKEEIVCPLHRYPFDVKTGKATAGMALCLDTFPLKIQDDGVFVGMKKSWWES